MSNGPKRTILDSFRDAFRGVWDCLKLERNMRVHLTACAYTLFFGFRMKLSRGEMACLALTIGAVMTAEALNTAVEKLCDFTEKHLNPRIRVIKDVAAGAVLLCALAAVGVGAFLFLRPELWTCLSELCARPLSLALLILSAVLALAFIVLGPEGLARLFRGEKRK